MKSNSFASIHGGCDCGHVRYTVHNTALFVHCCHCSWCQREYGAAFAINGLIESHEITLEGAPPILVDTPTQSGRGQQIARCPQCQVAVWSHYSALGNALSFLKVGSLDEPDHMPPDIHIFTQSKQGWFQLPADVPVVKRYYDRKKQWSKASLERLEQVLPAK